MLLQTLARTKVSTWRLYPSRGPAVAAQLRFQLHESWPALSQAGLAVCCATAASYVQSAGSLHCTVPSHHGCLATLWLFRFVQKDLAVFRKGAPRFPVIYREFSSHHSLDVSCPLRPMCTAA